MLPLTHEEANSLSSADAFGPFRMLHQIGVGVLGPVFRTYEPDRDRLVAVKVFRLSATPEQARALAEELSRIVELKLKLKHSAIVAPIAAGLTGTLAYLTQEYVAGESLDVAMRHYAPAPLDKALPFITQLASAIDLARAAGVTHGAMHPRDVFLTPDEVRVTGFGVVPALERVGLRGPIRRPYSAPERIAGEKWGPAADIFALAVIAFQLLTGRRPAGPGSQVVVLPGDISGVADVERLERTFADALADDPERRHASAQEFVQALGRAAGGEEVVIPGRTDDFVGEMPPAGGQGPPEASREISLDFGPLEQIEDPSTDELAPEGRQETRAREESEESEVVDQFAVARAASARLAWAEEEPDKPIEIAESATEPDPPIEVEEPDIRVEIAELATELHPPIEIEDVPDVRASQAAKVAEGSADSSDSDFESESEIESTPVAVPRRLPDKPIATGLTGVMLRPTYRDWVRRGPVQLVLTLVVGMLIAFVAGYGLGSRELAPSTPAATDKELPVADVTPPQSSPSAPAEQEWSEGTVERSLADSVPVAPTLLTAPVPSKASSPSISSSRPPGTPPPSPTTPPARVRPQPSVGRLLVRSSPPGAQVEVNDAPRGATPLALNDMVYGSYTLRVSRSGYEPQTREFSISAERPVATVAVELMTEGAGSTAPTRAVGSVFVESRPPQAQVFLDGNLIGRTPILLPDVAVGSHQIRISLDGYQVWSTMIRVGASERTRVGASLDRAPRR